MRHFALLLVLVFSTGARAQPGRRALTLDDALRLARENSRDLQAARARLDQARSTVTQAWSALLPTVAIQGKYTHNYKEVTLDLAAENQGLFGLAEVVKATSGNPVQNGAINAFEQQVAAATAGPPIVIQKAEQLDFVASLTVPLIIPYAYPALKSAKRNLAAARANYFVSEAQILLSVAQSFFAVAGADSLLVARKNAILVAKQTVDNAQVRLEAGVVNRVEVTRAQLALLRAEQAERETEDLREQTWRALATLLVLREPFEVNSGSDPAPPGESADELAESALKLRPEFAAAERTIEAYDAQVSSAKWRWAPSLSGFGNARARSTIPASPATHYSWALGLRARLQALRRRRARRLCASSPRRSGARTRRGC